MSAEELKTKGNEAFAKQDFTTALDFFTQAIQIDPNNNILYSNRSGAYASLGNYKSALDDAVKCTELKPDWSKGYTRKGHAESGLGLFRESEGSYNKALELDSNNTAARSALDNLQETKLNYYTSLITQEQTYLNPLISSPAYILSIRETLKKILDGEDCEISDTTLYAILLSFMSTCRDTELKTKLQKHLKIKRPQSQTNKTASNNPPDNRCSEEREADEFKVKANELYQKKNFEEALINYDKAIQLYPKNITYATNKAAVYLEMKDFKNCIATCEDILEKRYEYKADFEKVAKVYARLAVCYCRMEEYDEAVKMYEKALTEDNQRQYRAALNETKALREKKKREDYINPELAEEHRLKGNDFFKQNFFPEAKKEYDEAIRRNPSDSKLYANRSATLMKLLELPMALEDVDKSIELDPSVPKVWARKGKIHMLMKEYHKSMTAYQKGLSLDQNNVDCQIGLRSVMQTIQESMTSDKVDEEQVQHALSDPEIQNIMNDPQIAMIIRKIVEDPSQIREALKDPRIAASIQKLIAAGILKFAT